MHNYKTAMMTPKATATPNTQRNDLQKRIADKGNTCGTLHRKLYSIAGAIMICIVAAGRFPTLLSCLNDYNGANKQLRTMS